MEHESSNNNKKTFWGGPKTSGQEVKSSKTQEEEGRFCVKSAFWNFRQTWPTPSACHSVALCPIAFDNKKREEGRHPRTTCICASHRNKSSGTLVFDDFGSCVEKAQQTARHLAQRKGFPSQLRVIRSLPPCSGNIYGILSRVRPSK